MLEPPEHLDLDRERGLTVRWPDGRAVFYPVEHLRRHSPSADAREIRKHLEADPLTVLPTGTDQGPLHAESMELVGRYAVRITFSDGHRTGLYSWDYLRSIEPEQDSA